MNVSADGVLERDRFALGQLAGRGIPTVMLLSGGYSRESYRLVANTVASQQTEPVDTVVRPTAPIPSGIRSAGIHPPPARWSP